MIRTLVLASLLWAMAIPVRGETFANPPGYRCGPPDRTGVRLCEEVPDPCLAKMEAAMRAMDWYLPVALQRAEDNRWRSYMQLSDEGKRAVDTALQQWRDIKRDCWKEQQ
jgi:hypothetical protein